MPTRSRSRYRVFSPLCTVRRSRTLSREQLAQLIDVSLRLYTSYETGTLTPPLALRVRIAAILGTPHDVLWPPAAIAAAPAACAAPPAPTAAPAAESVVR